MYSHHGNTGVAACAVTVTNLAVTTYTATYAGSTNYIGSTVSSP